MKGVFTIAPGADFLASLAQVLWDDACHDPLRLAEATLFLPTRRACRHLQSAFQALTPAALLPRFQPLGDIDEEELYFASGLDIDIPPAIAPLRRLMLLAQLVQKKDASLSFDQAALLAEALAHFLDEAQTARCDMAKLHTLIEEKDLAAHWQQTVLFLEMLTKEWPKILDAEGGIDPAHRRDLVLKAQADAWRVRPPNHPVIAAGSTGTVPGTADLLAVIAGLPRGVIVLPGLDTAMDEEAWQGVEDTHPQSAMKHLLEKLDVKHADVRDWPWQHERQSSPPLAGGVRGGGDRQATPSPAKTKDLLTQVQVFASSPSRGEELKTRLLQDSMRPSAATRDATPAKTPPKLSGIARIACSHPQEEAAVIALAMREALEAPEKTAALVTPDRGLAARVVAALARWNIVVNDSAGSPLLAEAPGGFLASLLAAAATGAEAADYLALLKHPFAACGLDPALCRTRARELELLLWRSERPETPAWFDEIKHLLAPLAASWEKPLPLDERIETHIAVAESIAQSDKEEGVARLWSHEAGEATREWLDDWRVAARGFPPLSGGDYAALFTGLLRGTPYRPAYGLHPRLSILGPLEARLLRPDLVILGGLNEGTWPPEAGIDPWMSRPMRAAFGLPSPERRIGLSAHDFIQLAASPEVILTRASREGTALAVPSRFLVQLEAALRAQGYKDNALDPSQPYLAWARALDEPREIRACAPPEPKPPANVRPRQLSVTEIGTWRRNPYAIYAKHILKLKPLEPLEDNIDASDRGALVHAALEAFIKKFPRTLPANALDELLEIGRDTFRRLAAHPEIFALWWPRFERMAAWFIEHERARAAEGVTPLAAEAAGKIGLDGFTLKGRSDRIDKLPDGTYAITDYKTGAAPGAADVKTGLEPQLPLLALIATEGGFEDVPAADIKALSYLKLTGGRKAGEEQIIKADIAALTEDARNGLLRLVEKFADAAEPYRAVPEAGLAPRYDDYAHLARLAEWGRAGRDE